MSFIRIMAQPNKEPQDSLHAALFKEWVAEYGKYLLYAIGVAILLIVLLVRFFSIGQGEQVSLYVKTDRAFQTFIDPRMQTLQPEQWDEAFAKLQEGMAAYPNLHQKYDAEIAQVLLAKGFIEDTQPYAERTFTRVKRDHIPYYLSFAETSLLVGEKKYAEALQKAEELRRQMEGASDQELFGPLLYLTNLVRIGFLQQIVGQTERERETWELIQGIFAGDTSLFGPIPQGAIDTFQRVFTFGNSSLPGYIEFRLEKIKQS